MHRLRTKPAVTIGLILAMFGLGACQMTSFGPQDAKLFEDHLQ